MHAQGREKRSERRRRKGRGKERGGEGRAGDWGVGGGTKLSLRVGPPTSFPLGPAIRA